MGATVDALLRLQEIERQLAEVRQNVERRVRAVRRQESSISEVDRDLDAKRAALRIDQIEADRLDVDMRVHDASIAKLRQSLNQVKTNKEYSAILTQLNTEKADNGKLEDQVMTLLAEIDAKSKDIEQIRETRVKEVERLDGFEAEVIAVKEKSAARLDELTARRDKAAEDVPAGALELFNRVAHRNEGEALAMVVRTHPKRAEYVCEGCNMAITIEQVNAITSRDEAIVCNICGHILYMESQTVARA